MMNASNATSSLRHVREVTGTANEHEPSDKGTGAERPGFAAPDAGTAIPLQPDWLECMPRNGKVG